MNLSQLLHSRKRFRQRSGLRREIFLAKSNVQSNLPLRVCAERDFCKSLIPQHFYDICGFNWARCFSDQVWHSLRTNFLQHSWTCPWERCYSEQTLVLCCNALPFWSAVRKSAAELPATFTTVASGPKMYRVSKSQTLHPGLTQSTIPRCG